MKRAVVFSSIIALILTCILLLEASVYLTSKILLIYLILAIASIIAAITYTVGKKAYGYHGFGDVMVLLFFGFLSVLGSYSIYGSPLDAKLFLLVFFVGLLSVAVLNLNNMRDYENDKDCDKRTIVVQIGLKNAKAYHFLIIIIAVISFLWFLVLKGKPLLFIAMIPLIGLIFHLKRVKNNEELDPELKKVAMMTFLTSVLFFLGMLLI